MAAVSLDKTALVCIVLLSHLAVVDFGAGSLLIILISTVPALQVVTGCVCLDQGLLLLVVRDGGLGSLA